MKTFLYSMITLTFMLLLLCFIFLTPRVNTSTIYRTNSHYPFETINTYTFEETREKIEDEVGLCFYLYKEKPLPINNGGYSRVFIREVVMNSNNNINLYGIFLMHELIHVKHFTADETYVNFMTFKILYESNDAVLQHLAIYHAWLSFSGFYLNEYDSSELIYNYMQDNDLNYFEFS